MKRYRISLFFFTFFFVSSLLPVFSIMLAWITSGTTSVILRIFDTEINIFAIHILIAVIFLVLYSLSKNNGAKFITALFYSTFINSLVLMYFDTYRNSVFSAKIYSIKLAVFGVKIFQLEQYKLVAILIGISLFSIDWFNFKIGKTDLN